MSNPFNNGTIVGNTARAPKLFEHANGGATVKLSVYARNAFKNKSTGKVESEIVELTGYVQDAANPGVFGCIGSGDRVAVSYSLKTDVYADKDGQKHYPLVARIDTVQPAEATTLQLLHSPVLALTRCRSNTETPQGNLRGYFCSKY